MAISPTFFSSSWGARCFCSSSSGTSNLHRRTKEGAREVKGIAGALTGLIFSPVNFLKYLGIAIMQAVRGEGRRALAALGLALSAPVWSPVEAYVQALEGPPQRWPRYALERWQVFAEKGLWQ